DLSAPLLASRRGPAPPTPPSACSGNIQVEPFSPSASKPKRLVQTARSVWGEVSAGVNFFNPTANTSVFAKVDVTFGEDIDGVGGKASMRVAWQTVPARRSAR